jgi:hypothetical protein
MYERSPDEVRRVRKINNQSAAMQNQYQQNLIETKKTKLMIFL